MPNSRTRLGTQREELATRHLEALGFRILPRNFRTRSGEVDLVANEGETIVFVEVRTHRSQAYGMSEEAVARAKRQRLALVAEQYLQDHDLSSSPWRVDVEVDR